MKLFSKFFLVGFFVLSQINFVFSAESLPVELQEVGLEEHLGNFVSPSIPFRDEKNQPVLLGDFFDKTHPVILNLVYFECPNLCGFLLNGLMDSLNKMNWSVGDQFQMVTVSIDPTEDAPLASQKKQNYLKAYHRPSAEQGWHFLTGKEADIKKLAAEVGFKYKYDEDQKQYAHGAVIFILTPEGKISRYLYGIQFNPQDVKLALLEASKGKIGNLVDRFLMFCYHYDPKGRQYALYAVNMMKIAAALTVIGIVILVLRLRKKH